VPNRGWSKT